jgi:hypothetical protein
MTRSFDVFDRDDFRSPDDPDRGTSGGSESFWSPRVRLSELHRKEERADARDREGRGRSRQERPPLHREERVREILAQRVRTVFRDRDKTYELRDSEIHLLSEAGKFRVVAQNDLAEFAYNGDGSRMERDIENLQRQGLAEVKTILAAEHNPIKVVTLTKEGNKLLRQGEFWSIASARITDSRNRRKPHTMRTCTASITRSATRLNPKAEESPLCGLTMS